MGDKLYGLIGRKLGHSWSPPIHKALGCKDYRLIQLERAELADFLRREDIGGLNVTIPYKRDVMPLCDEIDPEAAAIGSVNTIVRRDGKLYGYNTDIDGFLYMLRRAGIALRGKKVVILGSGGAALTAQAAAKRERAAEIAVISRSGPDNYDNLPQRHGDAQVLVNTTPVGMWPNVEASPVDLRVLSRVTAVVDVIYNPRRTNLILQAEGINRVLQDLKKGPASQRWNPDLAKFGLTPEGWEINQIFRGFRTGLMQYTGGLPMLVAQAVRAEELFFDKRIPNLSLELLISGLQRDMTNIVLVGMPGCGKSTVGKALSALSGLPLVDLDEEIVRQAGRPIPEIFAQEGEQAFRDLESRVLAEAMAQPGRIVATGGGCVLRPENRLTMRRGGRVYFIQRALEDLPTDGRPLSQAGRLEEMYLVRQPLYDAAADASILNNAPAAETAREIWRDFCEQKDSGD